MARDGSLVVGVSLDVFHHRLEVVDPGNGRVLHQVPDDVYVRWSLSQDRRIAVIAAEGNIENRPSDVLIWRLGTPVTDIQRVPTGGEVEAIATCGADAACVLTDRQLVRIRLSDATVERRLTLPPDSGRTIGASKAGRKPGRPYRRDRSCWAGPCDSLIREPGRW